MITLFFIQIRSQVCPCDLISKTCDYRCCCDSLCPNWQLTLWKSNGLCSSRFNNGYNIPSCQDTFTTLSYDGGLQFLYYIVKSLLCISVNNQNLGLLATNLYLAAPSSLSPQLLSSPIKTRLLPGAHGGVCGAIYQTQWTDSWFSCLTSFSASNIPELLKADWKSKIINNSQFKSIKEQYFSMDGNAVAKPTTSFASSLLNSFVREAYIQVDLDVLTLSYLIDTATFLSGSTFSVRQQFFIVWTNGSQWAGSQQGYLPGQAVMALQIDSTGIKTIQTGRIRVPFSPGICANGKFSYLTLQFKKTQILSCWGSGTVDFTAILKQLQYLAKTGNAKRNRIKDFVKVTVNNNDTVSTWNTLHLRIYYSRVGQLTYLQYAIQSAVVNGLTSGLSGLSASKSIIVEWIQQENTVKWAQANPPTIQLYLPNDVLYPFQN